MTIPPDLDSSCHQDDGRGAELNRLVGMESAAPSMPLPPNSRITREPSKNHTT